MFSGKPDSKPHSYQALAVSRAPPPHLFLALQRADLLSRLIHGGIATVLYVLQLEWEAAPDVSWLGQVLSHVRTVSSWVSAAHTLAQCSSPLHELFEQVESSPGWWSGLIRAAIKAFLDDITVWQQRPFVACPSGGAFRCRVCGDSFAQRSFLAIHQARKHQLWASAQHFAPHRQCISCLRTYSTVMLVQAHLRRTPACLSGTACLMPPLDHAGIVEAEQADIVLFAATLHCLGTGSAGACASQHPTH